MLVHQNTGRNIAGLTIALGVTLAIVAALTAPLAAQDTIVEGAAQRGDYAEERVGYADLDLRDRSNQQMLVSRVRQASNKVCDIVYRNVSPMVKFNERCTHRSYRDARPQIDLAIANAQEGRRVAMSFVVAARK
ncbi:MAG: UrcA family protein [Sphingorhabdus sp.]